MESRKDMELAVKIRESLMRDERLSAHAINVAVVGGVVTLRGTVQSYRRKLAAIEIVESIRGCKSIVDGIVVIPDVTPSDETIAENVRIALDTHSDITKEVITVSVRNGVVKLEGRVASSWERSLARDVALGVRGVRDVKDLLIVDLGGKIEDEALMRNIQAAISESSELQDSDIRVAVTGNTAVLSGEVTDLWRKRRAGQIANRFRVSSVRNDVQVNSV
ncbi:MAG: BON domain-containing protein [Candidatus Latescibacterota bacterium]|jgi:osmotically-inducible protein OsmY